MFFDAVISFLVAGLAFGCTLFAGRSLDPNERRWLRWGYLVQLIGTMGFVYVIYFVYGGGDIFTYLAQGELVAERISASPLENLGEAILYFLQQPTPISAYLWSEESATGSMTAATGISLYILGGARVGTSVLMAFLGFAGRIGIYLAFRDEFAIPRARFYLAIACFGVPSVAFWGGGVVKETLAIFGLGWGTYGLVTMFRKGKPTFGGAIATLVGISFILMIKPYVLIPLTAAASAFLLVQRMQDRGRLSVLLNPLNLAVALGVALGGALLVGELFPSLSFEQLGDETARLQSYGLREEARGGSGYAIGDAQERSLFGQIAYSPIALFTAFFRPLVFEIHNALAAINALEMLVFQLLTVRIVRNVGLRQALKRTLTNPGLVFALVFSLLLALGVGLTTTNLGTLSRYRVPMMPFYMFLLLILGRDWSARKT